MAKRQRVFSPLDAGGGSVSGISSVPGLQTALDNKAPVSHTHIGSEIASGLPTFTNVYHPVYTIVDTPPIDINPANGAIQIWTLTANRTPTATLFPEGGSVTLHIADGTGPFAVTWSSITPTWVGGVAPTLPTSGYAVIVLWKANFVIYGTKVGDVA